MGGEDIQEVAAELTVTVPAGEYIFREGDPGAEMYIIQSGTVEIVASSGEGERRLATLGEGDFFGEMAILEDLPRTASARAAEECVLLRIDRGTFDQLIRHNPEISIRMLRKLCHRLRLANPALLGEGAPAAERRREEREEASTARAVLEHQETGTVFELGDSEVVTVGRFDPVTGQSPAVDLGALDRRRTTSRRHALLVHRGGRWYVREEVGTANGTFVNGRRIPTGQDVALEDGDRLRFGLVELLFHRS